MDTKERPIIKTAITKKAIDRRKKEPQRYPRNIDALLLQETIDIICNPELFNDNFRDPLKIAFPDGLSEARTFLNRISLPRNNLAHVNAIGLRQAEQIICYTNDVIDSLKSYYRQIGMQTYYEVPLILRTTDSFGNSFMRYEFSLSSTFKKDFCCDPKMFLHPGDILTLEIEVDPSYDSSSYTVHWSSTKPWSSDSKSGLKAVIPITNHQVGDRFDVQCRVKTNRDWHRLNNCDDLLIVTYRVLPLII